VKSIFMVHMSSGMKLGPEDKFVRIMTENRAQNCHYASLLENV
jgi:hypothetical protein